MTVSDAQLIETAKRARLRAYGQYSRYRVGCALLDERDEIHIGCNVENETYPLGSCAEAGAIAAMVVAGGRRIRVIAVVGGFDDPDTCTPCGGCRQRLAEFAGPDTPVHVAGPKGLRRTFSLGELLPAAFGLESEEP